MATINDLILILGGWTIITSSVIYFLSNRIADRLNIKWKETADSNIAKLQSELSKNNSTLTSLISLYSTNYHQAQDRRIKAIETLWTKLLEFNKVIPNEGHMIFNVLGEKEIEDYWTRQTDNKLYLAGLNALLNINENEHWKKHYSFRNLIENERPFLGENIWYLYELFNTFSSRIAHLLLSGRKEKKYKHWHHDGFIHQLLESYLNKQEVDYIYSIKVNSLRITIAFLENKLLQEINKTLSGETLSETAIDRIKQFEKILKINSD